jgi:hypothetical protein
VHELLKELVPDHVSPVVADALQLYEEPRVIVKLAQPDVGQDDATVVCVI